MAAHIRVNMTRHWRKPQHDEAANRICQQTKIESIKGFRSEVAAP